jgi:hypothetical protein
MTSAPEITPDTKDWTWVLSRPCPDCGFVAADLTRAEVGPRLRQAADDLQAVLSSPTAAQRPAPTVWSPLEYACHVRDVYRLYLTRLELMLAEDDPEFENWDQDQTAVDDAYGLQDPQVVARELDVATDALVARFLSLGDDVWTRTGRRSDGAHFTITSFSQYLVHDPVHHVHDVQRA